MKSLITDLFTYLDAALGQKPSAFLLSVYPSPYNWSDLRFSSFDSDMEARLAILGGLQKPTDEALEDKIIRALDELTGDETYRHPDCDHSQSVGFDISVERNGAKCVITLVSNGTKLERCEDADNNAHALPKKLRELLELHQVASFVAEFSGGGDSGQCDGITVMNEQGDDVTDSELENLLQALADKVSESVSIDWYNNDGGGGTLSWAKGDKEAESSFYYNYESELPETTVLEVELEPEISVQPLG